MKPKSLSLSLSPTNSHQNGFSLIITITMMVLLSLIAVGLLSLSETTLRAATATKDEMIARSNARLALAIAIGELQKHLGPDRSISANASLVIPDAKEPELVGAWESWQWDPEEGGSPNYSEKSELFKGWLVSTPNRESMQSTSLPSNTLPNSVLLMKPRSSAAPNDGLRASLVSIGSEAGKSDGGYAYAVIDESLRIPINLPSNQTKSTGEEIARRTAPARPHPELFVEELQPDKLKDPSKLVTLDTASMATGRKSFERYRDSFSTRSLSLLTDPVLGGFKKDLTTAFESSAADINFVDTFGKEALYFDSNDGALTWDYLKDHYLQYRALKSTGDGTPRATTSSNALRPGRLGTELSPDTERLLPVISRLQVVFSLVTHYSHIGDRVSFFNQRGLPRGNTNYGCPHLVYDPVITLYNPYDVEIELQKLRIRIWDPPVTFGFKKNDQWLRPEHARGELHGLARFQIANEKNPEARKYFTLLLSEMRGSRPGQSITLEPGELRVFSPWVEENWTWALEAGSGYNPRSFFDWNQNLDFGNQDKRTNNQFGLEAVPGWDIRAGLQTDHLSYGGDRPVSTQYDFERGQGNGNAGWLGIKMGDTVSVVSKPARTLPARDRGPDFQVDILAARNTDVTRDLLRSYSFRFDNVAEEISAMDTGDEIERTFLVSDLLQAPSDRSPGGKTPFASITMSAKTTSGYKDVSKPWLYNHPVVEGLEQDTRRVGNALDSYDLRFEEVTDFNSLPGVEFNPDTNQGYYGSSSSASEGSTHVPMFNVPTLPATSLGNLIPGNLAPSSALPRVTRPFGSARAHPLIPSSAVSKSLGDVDRNIFGSGTMLDHSYLLNNALWDHSFFSTLATFNSDLLDTANRKEMLESFFENKSRLLNPRFVPLSNAAGQADELESLSPQKFMETIAGSLAVEGGFNVNSDSVEAWQMMLTSLRDQQVVGWGGKRLDSSEKTSFPRSEFSLSDGEGQTTGITIEGPIEWSGYRSLTDRDITNLAQAIVTELRERGESDKSPNLSLAEFVNRRISGSNSLHSLAGLLETAIEKSGINQRNMNEFSSPIPSSAISSSTDLNGLAEPAAQQGETAEGSPPMLTQSDLLMPLASVMTVRGDTFRIRAYGEARGANNRPTARAWCEAVVQRIPQYLDPSDEPEIAEAELKSQSNKSFGRRFLLTSFRWLSPEEI